MPLTDEQRNEAVMAHWEIIVKTANQFARCRDEADDLTQAGATRVLQGLGQAAPRHLPAWIQHVARNAMIDVLRTRNLYRRRYPQNGDLLSGTPTRETRYAWSDERDTLERCLPMLSVERREVVRLKRDGLTHERIGQRLGIPAGTAKTRLLSAVRELRKMVA
jgi:RNA polymerase sigma-70 factor, ECF subfamily